MALQIRRGTNAERLGITLVEGEVVYVTDFELTTIEVTSINASTNVLTTTLNHGLTVNQKIKFQGTTGNGLTNDQVYFVKTIPSQVEFTLSTTQGGTTLDITGTAASLIFAVGPTDATGTPYGYSISPLYVGDGITAGGNPAGSSVLDDLYDVSIGVYGNVGQYGQALANNNVFQYNSTTDQWENRANLTLNGSLSQTGQTLNIDSDSLGGDSRIYFKGTTAEIKYDATDDRFELNKDLIASGLQGGNIQIGVGAGSDNQIYLGGNNLQIDTQAGYYIQSNAEFRTSADAVYINSDNTNTPSTLYFKGANNYIRLNTATGFFEFTDNIAKQNLVISADGSSAAVATTTGQLNLNTPVGSVVNVQRDLVVGGNLTVNGTTTTVNSTTLTVDDKNIELAATASPSDATADGGGITLRGTTDKKIFWDNATDRWYYDSGDGANNIFVRDLTDLTNVQTTGFVKGDMFVYDGTNWINDNKVQADASLSRAVFQYNNNDVGARPAALFARRNFTSPSAFALGDGVSIGFQVSNDNGAPTTFATVGAIYDSSPVVTLRTSTDNFSTNIVDVAKFNNTTISLQGTNLVLNANNAGAASDAQITVERGTTGADAYIKWDEDATTPQWFIGQQTQIDGRLAVNGSIFTEAGGDLYIDGTNLVLNNGNAAQSCFLTVSRPSNSVTLRWNESNDRWETTTDGTNYIAIPNQGLDTGNSPSFLGVTAGNIRVGVTGDNEIDTSTGNLTIDSAGGTTTIDDAVIINDNLTVNGTTTLGNAAIDSVNIVAGTVNIGTTVTTTVTVGDASTDTLTVNATSTFNNNLTVGSDSTDTMTVNSTANFNNNVTLGSDGTDTLSVNANTTFNNTVTIGNDGTDDLYVNATTYINNNLDIGSTSGDTLSVNSLVDTDIQFKDVTNSPRGIRGTVGTSDTWFVGGFATTSTGGANGQLIIATADDGTEPIYVRQYTGTILSGTVTNELTLLDGSGDTSIPNNLTVGSSVSCTQLVMDGRATHDTGATTKTSTAEFTLDSTARNAIKAMIYMTRGTDSHVLEILMMRTATGAMITTYGEMYTTSPLATFTADLDTGLARIRATPTSATSTTFSLVRTSLS